MSEGTLFLNLGSPRSSLFKDLVEYLKLDIKIAPKTDPELAANFPLKRTPSFLGKNGYKLHETIAILVFLISLAPDAYPFYGKDKYDAAQVWKWVSFANSDMVNSFVDLFMLAKTDADKQAALSSLNSYADLFEEQLKSTPYLVGDKASLADIFCVQSFKWGFQTCWDKSWLAKHPYIAKWFRNVCDNDPIASKSLKGFAPVDSAKF